jgi:hypothetical protein
MDEQMKKWVLQSTSDEAFYAMTDEEFDERCNRLAFKTLNEIVDEEVIANKERHYRRVAEKYGQDYADKERTMFGD